MRFLRPSQVGWALIILFGGFAGTASAAAQTTMHAKPGDQLVIRGWPATAFGPPLQVTVDPRGNIVLPQVGEVEVGRIPVASLRDTLRDRYGKFIRNPEVDVTVLRRVTVNGAVLRPSVYFVDMTATLRDVIATAGGVTEVGNRKKVSVIRAGETRRVPQWETDTSEASQLESGDQIVVGRRMWIELNIIPLASLGLATASFLLSLRK
jgi:protein involved in polysaccharide export with SLBB domain